jgi:hypothetical protein
MKSGGTNICGIDLETKLGSTSPERTQKTSICHVCAKRKATEHPC